LAVRSSNQPALGTCEVSLGLSPSSALTHLRRYRSECVLLICDAEGLAVRLEAGRCAVPVTAFTAARRVRP
jgi:hypothetical protein